MTVRDKLLKTASRLFHTQGYKSTGINQIIKEAGIAKGSFYYNFKSKEDLCIAFLDERHTFWFSNLKGFIQSNKGANLPVLLAFDFLYKMNEKENFQGCSFINLLSEIDESNTEILKLIQKHKSDLRDYLANLVNQPESNDHVYLLFESAIIESKLFRDQWPILKTKQIVESLIK